MLETPEKPDRTARALALAIAAGRIGIGAGALLLTRPALSGLGFTDPEPGSVALARLAGSRDIAIGAQALSVRDDRRRLREATVLGAFVDACDGLAFLALGAGGARRAALRNAPLGAAAALAGAFVASRLG